MRGHSLTITYVLFIRPLPVEIYSAIAPDGVLYYLGIHKMKDTVRALFAVAMCHQMCYEIICDHVHNRVNHVHNSVDHVYNRGNHMHNLASTANRSGR